MQPNITEGIIWYVVFLYSTVFHEAAHAWASYKLGDDTAYRGGQVSLDPTPHITREPVGMILMPLLSYVYYGWMMGFAHIPYDQHWALRYPKRAALMSMAGPAANGILALLSGALIVLGTKGGHFVPDIDQSGHDTWALVGMVLFITFKLNTLSVFFNLLPLPPLDGSALPSFFLKGSKAEQYQHFIWQPHIVFLGLMIAYSGAGQIAWRLFYHVHALLIQLCGY